MVQLYDGPQDKDSNLSLKPLNFYPMKKRRKLSAELKAKVAIEALKEQQSFLQHYLCTMLKPN